MPPHQPFWKKRAISKPLLKGHLWWRILQTPIWRKIRFNVTAAKGKFLWTLLPAFKLRPWRNEEEDHGGEITCQFCQTANFDERLGGNSFVTNLNTPYDWQCWDSQSYYRLPGRCDQLSAFHRTIAQKNLEQVCGHGNGLTRVSNTIMKKTLHMPYRWRNPVSINFLVVMKTASHAQRFIKKTLRPLSSISELPVSKSWKMKLGLCGSRTPDTFYHPTGQSWPLISPHC